MDFKSLRVYVEDFVAEQTIKASGKIIDNVIDVEGLINQKVENALNEVEKFLGLDDSPAPQAKPEQSQYINLNLGDSFDSEQAQRIAKTIREELDRLAKRGNPNTDHQCLGRYLYDT